jgi:hypothetical protein
MPSIQRGTVVRCNGINQKRASSAAHEDRESGGHHDGLCSVVGYEGGGSAVQLISGDSLSAIHLRQDMTLFIHFFRGK